MKNQSEKTIATAPTHGNFGDFHFIIHSFICVNNSCILKCFRSKGGFERMNKEKKRQKDKEDLEMISNVQGKLLNGYHE